MLTVGLAALMGYLLHDERTGLRAFLFSQVVALGSIPWTFFRFPPVYLSGWYSVSKSAINPLLEAQVVAGLAILIFLLGSLSVLGGVLLRDRTVPEWSVRLDWRFLAAGLLADAIAVLWPITPPYPQGYTPGSVNYTWVVPARLGDLADPVMAALLGFGLVLVLAGFRRGTSSSFATLPVVIGSIMVGGLGLIAHGFTNLILMTGWLLVFSLSVPTITIIGLLSSKKTWPSASEIFPKGKNSA
jgi:hypothetical protein